jgi:hypothetical protein
MSEIHEIEIRKVGDRFHIVCGDEDCKASDSGWVDALSLEDAEEAKLFHMRWHENGMPQ